MQDEQSAKPSYVQTILPWVLGGAALVLYLLTLNRWFSIGSLNLAARVSGAEPLPPLSGPLLFLFTYPLRWLSAASQPIALNALSAIWAALTAVILARSVTLLPHDRTHEQRTRERSDYSLLTIPSAWLPPVFAVLAFILELTMWENSIVGTGEVLDVLIFSWLILCLLEFRIAQKDGWLYCLAFVYGLGVTNNYALIGFFPLFLIALIWIKGLAFFRPGFMGIMLLLGLAGLSLYLLLPALRLAHGGTGPYTFGDYLRSSLAAQKAYLGLGSLRSRVLILSLTCVLPIIVMGIRWPSSFGETSAAGSAITNVMFRVVHIMFLAACIFITLDQKFSPRALGYGLPFLTFYYLGALAIGYYSGYVLLVFGQEARRSSRRRSGGGLEDLFNPVLVGAVWVAAIGLPAWLFYKNLPTIRADSGAILRGLTADIMANLPANGSIVLTDDAIQSVLLTAEYGRGGANRNMVVNTRQLESASYHDQLAENFPGRWPKSEQTGRASVDPAAIQSLVAGLVRSNTVYYLHPSFGYFFEVVQLQPRGPVYQLQPIPANRVEIPQLTPQAIQENGAFWNKAEPFLQQVEKAARTESTDARFVANFYSRGLNYWGVQLQKAGKLAEALPLFKRAFALNTNNIPAMVNEDVNDLLRAGKKLSPELSKITEDKFGNYRSWDAIMGDNGPFDDPSYAFVFGESLLQQSLYRQAALTFERVKTLVPEHFPTRTDLCRAYLFGQWPDQAAQALKDARADFQNSKLSLTNELDLVTIEAGVQFAKSNFTGAEKILRDALAAHPNERMVVDPLVEMYRGAGRPRDAIALLDQQLAANPADLGERLVKADVLMKTDQFKEARDEVDKVLKASPNNPTALIYRAFIGLRSKQYKEALDDVGKALAADPENIQALIYDGIINLESKNYEQGLPSLDKAIKLQPNNWVARQNRAILNLQAGKLKEAKADYNTLLRAFPENYAIYYGLGEIAYRQKNKSEAIKDYEMYLKLIPEKGSPEQMAERDQVAARLKELKAGG